MFENYNYKKLLTTIIGRIPYDINHETFKKLNITIDTLKKKKKKKLSIKELDTLNIIIRKLNNTKDEKFKEKVSRNLKLFLIYGNITNIEPNTIELSLTNDKLTSNLIIHMNYKGVTAKLNNDEYIEEASYENYLTIYKTKKIKKEVGSNITHFGIEDKREIHIFNANKEIASVYINTNEDYNESNTTKKRNYSLSFHNNFTEKNYFFRDDNYIIKRHEIEYFKQAIAKNHNKKVHEIGIDYNPTEKYLNINSYYLRLEPEEYDKYMEKELTAKQLIKKANK